MKLWKVTLIMVLITALSLGVAYAAPKDKDDPGQGKGQSIERTHPESPGRALGKDKQSRVKLQAQIRQFRTLTVGKRISIRPSAREQNEQILKKLQESLAKLERSRWAYNPNDTRGQGNMGRPAMISPYGQDKDSDRLALYGNRGRVIKEPEPTPTPPPEPVPEPTPIPEPTPDPTPTPPPEPDPYYPPY